MSAINVLVRSDAVHLLTDAAIYQKDGNITAIGPKCRPMPHLNCAVAMRGAYLGMAPIMEEIQAANVPFDELKSKIVDLLKACSETYASLLDQCADGPDFEIVLAGISESEGPQACLIASHNRYGEPWRVLGIEGLTALPCDETILKAVQTRISGRKAEDVDPISDGLAIMEIQRASSRLSNGELCIVGGFAQLTTVTVASITTGIIRRW